ncbi:hypothetical protein Indivirus_4_37 [Indivirus ILV1]|uniref:Uncharacterized protein n=1 Tax=Indivirus ILV1 TaxID=1977633 RepID=A0A1V0SDS7_9VIRU|nr:hypothetical protein Indivirus_4_37 [Indivirus ILV1]
MSSKFYKKIDNYFTNIKTDIQKKLDTTTEYDYNFINENDINIIEVISNGKIILKAEYCILGLYNIGLSVWYWGWGIDFINRKFSEKLKVIKDFPQTLEKDHNKFRDLELEELYFITNNSNFYCSSQNLDRIIRFALYMINAIWYVPIKYSDNQGSQMDKIEYIALTKILQVS